MRLYSEDKDYKIYSGSMLDMLDVIEPNSIDSIITDPPYELGFMAKSWDKSGIAFQKETWEKCFNVLKSGGYLLAFGGSRTFHRIACAIEDAGFEIRDTIMWLYGSGFPKSMNIGLAVDKKNGVESEVVGLKKQNGAKFKLTQELINNGGFNDASRQEFEVKKATNEWAGWGTQLKPAYEPIIVARKPIENTIVDNVLKYRVGGINIDECRVGDEHFTITNGEYDGAQQRSLVNDVKRTPKDYYGRFPANVILTYDETDKNEVCGGMPYTSSTYKADGQHEQDIHRENAEFLKYGYAQRVDSSSYNDEGSASRYFYCAKANKKDRDEGLMLFEEKTAGQRTNRKDGSAGINAYAGATGSAKNFHPTVKPIELMQYLVRLVSPKGATILDCFMGSGSTGKAVMFENRERKANYKFIGIELTEEYLPICKSRIDYGKYKYEYDIKQEQAESMKEHGFMQQSIFDL